MLSYYRAILIRDSSLAFPCTGPLTGDIPEFVSYSNFQLARFSACQVCWLLKSGYFSLPSYCSQKIGIETLLTCDIAQQKLLVEEIQDVHLVLIQKSNCTYM